MLLEEQSLVFKGRFKRIKTKEMPVRLQHTGVLIKSSLSYNTRLVVLGETKNAQLEQKARRFTTNIYSEDEFIETFQIIAETSERWNRLRELLSQPIDDEHWKILCQHFSLWPEEQELELALDYAAQHLSQLEDRLRRAPMHWLKQIMDGKPQPRLHIVKTCEFMKYYGSPAITDTQAQNIAETSSLSRVKTLDFGGRSLGEGGLIAICNSSHFPQVETLSLQSSVFHPSCLKFLANSESFPNLRHLKISNYEPHRDEPIHLKTIAESPNFSKLETLSTFRGKLTAADAEALANTANLPSLRSLSFYQPSGLSKEIIDTLASSTQLPQLSEFHFEGGYLELADIKSLFHAPFLQELEVLNLRHNKLGDEGISYFAKHNEYKQIKSLNLEYNHITEVGCKALMASPHLPSLERLIFKSNPIKDQGLEYIANSPLSNNLIELSVGVSEFTEDGLTSLAQSPHLTNLRVLGLSNYSTPDNWGLIIARSPYFPKELTKRWEHLLPKEEPEYTSLDIMRFAAQGDTESIQKAISQDANPADIELWDSDLLEKVVTKGHKESLSLLLDNGLNVNAVDRYGRSILHILVGEPQLEESVVPEEWLELLLKHSIDLSLLDNNGFTVLHLALAYGYSDCVEPLLEAGVPLEHVGVSGARDGQWHKTSGSVLHMAACSGHKESPHLVKRLLEAGADPNIPDENGQLPIHAVWNRPPGWEKKGYWEIQAPHIPAAKALMEAMKDVDVPDSKGKTPLFYAVITGSDEQIRWFCDKGADPNHKLPRSYKRPIHEAARSGKSQSLSILLDAGANPNAQTSKGETALFLSMYGRNEENVELLLKAGADPNTTDKKGQNPLFQAAIWGRTQHTKRLLEFGADPNITDKEGISPLLIAVRKAEWHGQTNVESEHTLLVQHLLAAGADPEAAVKKDTKCKYVGEFTKGDTPRSLASEDLLQLFDV